MPNINLFAKDAIFISEEKNKEKIFQDIYQDLIEKEYLKAGFFKRILKREQNFPTGLSLKTLGNDLPNIALPHIEGDFVQKRLIVPVALKYPVSFNKMIAENESLSVKFLFMLLAKTPDGQAKLLSQMLNFLAHTPQDELKQLFTLDNPVDIYQFLSEKF